MSRNRPRVLRALTKPFHSAFEVFQIELAGPFGQPFCAGFSGVRGQFGLEVSLAVDGLLQAAGQFLQLFRIEFGVGKNQARGHGNPPLTVFFSLR